MLPCGGYTSLSRDIKKHCRNQTASEILVRVSKDSERFPCRPGMQRKRASGIPWVGASLEVSADVVGCSDLARTHEDLALESAADDADTRMTMTLLHVNSVSVGFSRKCVIYVTQMVAKGKYDDALATLMAYDSISKMSITSYHRWARAVWTILHRQGSLRSVPRKRFCFKADIDACQRR